MKSEAKHRPYTSTLREEQAEATRVRILETMARLITHESPAEFSIPRVAKESGVAVRTVYRYFPTKAELFNGLFTYLTGVEQSVVSTPRKIKTFDDLLYYSRLFRDGASRHPEFSRALRLIPEYREMNRERMDDRRIGIKAAMRDATKHLDEDTARRVHAIVHLISATDAFLFMNEHWGLSAEEASEATEWALRTLRKAARQLKGKGKR